jgi:hypothetical protein
VAFENDVAEVLEVPANPHLEGEKGGHGIHPTGRARTTALLNQPIQNLVGYRLRIPQRTTRSAKPGNEIAARGISSLYRNPRFGDGRLQMREVRVGLPEPQEGNHETIADDPEVGGLGIRGDHLVAEIRRLRVTRACLGRRQAIANGRCDETGLEFPCLPAPNRRYGKEACRPLWQRPSIPAAVKDRDHLQGRTPENRLPRTPRVVRRSEETSRCARGPSRACGRSLGHRRRWFSAVWYRP